MAILKYMVNELKHWGRIGLLTHVAVVAPRDAPAAPSRVHLDPARAPPDHAENKIAIKMPCSWLGSPGPGSLNWQIPAYDRVFLSINLVLKTGSFCQLFYS